MIVGYVFFSWLIGIKALNEPCWGFRRDEGVGPNGLIARLLDPLTTLSELVESPAQKLINMIE